MAANSGQQKTTYLTKLTDFKSTDVEGVGTIRWKNGKKYKWVQLTTGSGSVASVVGGVVGYLATDDSWHTVCTDQSDCFANIMAGQIQTAGITTANFCWIQIGGQGAILTNDVGSVGDGMTMHASSDDTLIVNASVADISGCVLLDSTASAHVIYLICPE